MNKTECPHSDRTYFLVEKETSEKIAPDYPFVAALQKNPEPRRSMVGGVGPR